MPVYYLDLLADDYVSEDGEEREDGWERGFSVNGPEGYIIDFEAICEVSNALSPLVRVSDDDNFVAAIDEFLGA